MKIRSLDTMRSKLDLERNETHLADDSGCRHEETQFIMQASMQANSCQMPAYRAQSAKLANSLFSRSALPISDFLRGLWRSRCRLKGPGRDENEGRRNSFKEGTAFRDRETLKQKVLGISQGKLFAEKRMTISQPHLQRTDKDIVEDIKVIKDIQDA